MAGLRVPEKLDLDLVGRAARAANLVSLDMLCFDERRKLRMAATTEPSQLLVENLLGLGFVHACAKWPNERS